MNKLEEWMSRHRLFSIVIIIAFFTILTPVIISVAKNTGLFSDDFEGWMCFWGGFAGGITALISVLITIHHGDKEREREKRENYRVYLDIMFHENASVESIGNYESHVFKTLYLFDRETRPEEHEHFAVLQIINRSAYQVNQA